jgi:hypothetical protein
MIPNHICITKPLIVIAMQALKSEINWIEQRILDTNVGRRDLSCHRYLIKTDVEKMNNI